MLKKNLKHTTRLLFLLSMCVGIQVSAPGCDQEDTGPDTSMIGTIYSPTNDYEVVAVITGLGVFGCAQVTVEDGAGNLVTDATVEMNNIVLVYDGVADAYTDEDESAQLDYDEGEVYELTVTIDKMLIAEGIVRMPTSPTIISPVDSATHLLNQALTVITNAVKYATSVQVQVDTPYIDADGNWLDDSTYTFDLPSGQQGVSIPGAVFNVTGWYEISVVAVSGVSASLLDVGITDYDMGYNIKGPRGVFIALALFEFSALFIAGTGGQTASIGSLRRQVNASQPATSWKRQWERLRRKYPLLGGKVSGSAFR